MTGPGRAGLAGGLGFRARPQAPPESPLPRYGTITVRIAARKP